MRWAISPSIELRNPRIDTADADRQQRTATEICRRLNDQFGVVLADEVGMGKTFVALAVAVSAIHGSRSRQQVVIMVPPAVKEKWPRDWAVFRDNCMIEGGPRVRATETAIGRGGDFLKLLDDPPERRKHLIFLTHGALSSTLGDPFIQLAILRTAFRWQRSLAVQRHSFCRWAPRLLNDRKFKPEHVERLLQRSPGTWRSYWTRHVTELDDDPVPAAVLDVLDELDLTQLRECLGGLPRRESKHLARRLSDVRREMGQVLEAVWREALTRTKASLPLLVLDEAHHVKNENQLASLFSSEQAVKDADALRGPLADVFDRMLFLSATPFQLGHQELIRVLARFDGVSASPDEKARYREALEQLGRTLDAARAGALRLERTWGRVTQADVNALAGRWSEGGATAPGGLSDVGRAVLTQAGEAHLALRSAEGLLRPWIIRHTKTRLRTYRPGVEILDGAVPGEVRGLEVVGENTLPFLLAARAQAHVALSNLHEHSSARAMFADGLASSYEAYLQTRTAQEDEIDDAEAPQPASPVLDQLSWYLDHIAASLPASSPEQLGKHPKVEATTSRVIDLWRRGEKVLVFCFYRATGRALRAHISRALREEVATQGAARLGIVEARTADVIDLLERRAASWLDGDAPGVRVIQERVARIADDVDLDECDRTALTDVVTRFMRTPSFLVRYVDLASTRSEPAIDDAFQASDGSGVTLLARLEGFTRHVAQLTPEEKTVLWDALRTVQTGTISTVAPDTFDPGEGGVDRMSTLPNVRLANGLVDRSTRARLMQTFNTPFFPEVLIASAVMAEGVDLHLECRHIIHHDLDWNPSTLEQRTGRLDRLGSKSARSGLNIDVFEPFVAGTQDERQYRVVKDREAWFQALMGGGTEAMGEAATDQLAARVPMPDELAALLRLDLSVLAEA